MLALRYQAVPLIASDIHYVIVPTKPVGPAHKEASLEALLTTMCLRMQGKRLPPVVRRGSRREGLPQRGGENGASAKLRGGFGAERKGRPAERLVGLNLA